LFRTTVVKPDFPSYLPNHSMRHQIRALLVDDEKEAHDVMERLLLRIGGIEIVGHVFDAGEVLASVRIHRPDIIFLDIQMPGKDGICVANDLKLNKIPVTVIFVTAFSKFALAALKASAFDYLLKPVDIDDLQEVINRYRSEKGANSLEEKLEILIENYYRKQKLLFNTRSGCIVLDENEIIFCRADVNYTRFYLTGKREELVTLNIARVMEMLRMEGFYRLDRSHIINLSCLRKVDRSLKMCELIKDNERYTIKAPLSHLKELEQKLRILP
jgi:two-component system, LytTR family, response regulator